MGVLPDEEQAVRMTHAMTTKLEILFMEALVLTQL
jgi:hypothetical protein